MSEPLLDWQCILIQKDKEVAEHVDYFFTCDVLERDPRYKKRSMCTGQRRGLFRVHKNELRAELLFPMEFDTGQRSFDNAANKILRAVQSTGSFPDLETFMCG